MDLAKLATKLAQGMSEEESSRVVGVGTSGKEFARSINPCLDSIDVSTVAFDTARENRVLSIEQKKLLYEPVLVDDIAVSGLTLSLAARAVEPRPVTALVGMAMRSKTMRRRINLPDIQIGLTYMRDGGGNVPINSVASLQAFPDRLDALSERYFAAGQDQFKEIVRSM